MQTQTIQELAADFASRLTVRKRDNGTEYTAHDDPIGSPLANLCHAAHGDFGPDDKRYEMISRALDAISEADDPDSIEYEAPVYTGQLTAWLASDVRRVGYCDDAADGWGFDDEPTGGHDRFNRRTVGLDRRIAAGWLQEMSEVHELVMAELHKLTA